MDARPVTKKEWWLRFVITFLSALAGMLGGDVGNLNILN